MGAKQSRNGYYAHHDSFSRGSTYSSSPRPSYAETSSVPERTRELNSIYKKIGDNYTSLDQVTVALAESGLESSNLIVGIDFTKSNEWTGKQSFGGRSLHHVGEGVNPYEHAISIIGRTLSAFDEDNLIPCFGFGDVSTHDKDVFSFYPDNKPCDGFEEALSRYREIVPHVRLAGPTSFAPIIKAAISIVDQSGGQYHVLVIIADGQVTRSVDTGVGRFSPQEKATIDAIVKASEYPLSIIVVGVGDGPWDIMHELDDNIPARAFDNIQFVNFTEIMSRNVPLSHKETEFALAALMEIPLQYRATLELQLSGHNGRGGNSRASPFPPPIGYMRSQNSHSLYLRSSSYSQNLRSPNHHALFSRSSSFTQNFPSSRPPSPHPTESSSHSRNCPVCFYSRRDLALGCGHQICQDCGGDLTWCPICRTEITTRIRLYD